MAKDILKDRFNELERIAIAAGLRPYDVHFFEVPASVIYEVASYGLPTRYNHWSFGKVYQYQKTQGEMGFSKIYELILNNDPSFAFLDKSNTDTINLMIAAHCYAHSDFFRNNIMFCNMGETDMIQVAKRHANAVDQYRKDYGDEEVDEWLDIALALEKHIDVFKGLKRKRYPSRSISFKERVPSEWEDIVFDERKPLVKRVQEGLHIPPNPEKDILWFLSEYSNLEEWQIRIFEIVRRESYYFYPQYRTKIMNEGWASYWHAELMRQYAYGNDNDFGATGIDHPLTSEEHLDFVGAHEKVVQPGLKMRLKVEQPEYDAYGRPTGRKVLVTNPIISENPHLFNSATRLNPYYVGFCMFRDIKKRWDEYYEQGYRVNEFDEEVEVTINGSQKIREAMIEEDDVSFLRKYLTEKLVDELHLFGYGNISSYNDEYKIQEEICKRESKSDLDFGEDPLDEQVIDNKTISVRNKKVKDILNTFARSHSNYGVPLIVVRRVDEAGMLRLEHLDQDSFNLDVKYAEHVLKYIGKAWGRPVELVRKDPKTERTWILKYDGYGFEVNYERLDYPDVIEKSNVPSSW